MTHSELTKLMDRIMNNVMLLIGPGPFEALANGCAFIQPLFKTPHSAENTVSIMIFIIIIILKLITCRPFITNYSLEVIMIQVVSAHQ